MSHFNLCRYFLTWSISLIAMSGCNQFTVNRSHDFSKAVDVSSLGSKQISTIAGTAGVETAALSAGSAFTQELEASNASTISGTILQFPPGSLSINTDISLEEGSAVATNSTASALNLGSSISNAGAAVVINSSAAVDPVQPFVLKINLGSGNLNLADATENLIVIYKVQIFAENRFVLGVLPRSALTIEGQKVSFSAQYFGVFQTAYAEKPVLEESKVTVAEAIQTKREAVTLPPPSFTSLELTHVAIDSVINEAEKSLTSPIWQLNASSYTEASFTEALDDSGKALLCDGTKAYKRLSIPTPAQLKTDGPLAICVRLTDAAGRIVYGKSQAIVRDTTPPNFISLAKSAAGADGYVNASEINQSLALWFLNASGYTSLGFSNPFMESALPHTCDANDNYRTDRLIPSAKDLLSDGAYSLCVQLIDNVGNISYGKGDLIVRDTVSPVFNSLSLFNAASDGFINSSEKSANVPLWSLDALGYSQVDYTEALAEISPISCDASKTYSQATIAAPASINLDANYVLCVRLKDQAGNISFGKSVPLVVDTQAPVLSSLTLANAASDGYIASGESSSSLPAWVLTGSGYSSATYTTALDNTGNSLVCHAALSYAATSLPAIQSITSDGVWSVCVRLSDLAGNIVYGKAPSLTRDTSSPMFSSLSLANAAVDGYVNKAEYLSTPTDLAGSLVASGYASVSYKLVSSATPCTNTLSYGSMPQSNSADFTSDGLYKICVKLVDLAANPPTFGSSNSFNFDQTLPSFAGLGEILAFANGTEVMLYWGAGSDNYSSASALTYAICFSATAGQCVSNFTENIHIGANTWNYKVGGLTAGTVYEFVVRARDEAGNLDVNTKLMKSATFNGVTAIAAGGYHSCALMADQTVKCWGQNANGELGDGTYIQRNTPTTVWGLSNVSSLALGPSHSCARLLDQTVKCWGWNGSGQLGDGTTMQRSSPVMVTGLTNVTALALGQSHSCAVLGDQTMKCWGYNANGQLGDGTLSQHNSPVLVSGLSGVSSLALGSSHSCALLADQTVRCWGYNANGQLGDGTLNQSMVPVTVGSLSSVSSLALGANHSCAILSDQTVRCWGINSSGQIGDGTYTQRPNSTAVSGLSNVSSLALGYDYGCARLNDQTVKCWGANYMGQLGDGTLLARASPVLVTGLTGAAAIAVGQYHSCALLSDQTVKCWGSNNTAQLGNGTMSQRSSPVSAVGVANISSLDLGYAHTCALLSDQTVKCWGSNVSGQLGDGTLIQRSSPVQVLGLSGVSALALGTSHSCALLSDQTVKCWGYNGMGQLGDATGTQRLSPVAVQSLSGVTAIALGAHHSCALTSDQTVKCWGYNYYGQLGDGTTVSRFTAVAATGLSGVTALALGDFHSCAVLSDQSAKCWGYNVEGQVGNGSVTQQYTPVTVTGLAGVSSLALGGYHSCARLSDQTMKCWGNNIYGQIGDASTTQRLSPVAVSGLSGVSSLAVGTYFSCALLTDQSVKCWGQNNNGELGDGSTVSHTTPNSVVGLSAVNSLSVGSNHSCVVLADQSAKCWGLNGTSQLGDGTLSTLVPDVSVASP